MTPEQAKVLDEIRAKVAALWTWTGGGSNATEYWKIKRTQTEHTAQLAALTAVVEKLADQQGLDGATITKTVTDAVSDALSDLTITLTTDSEVK